MRCLPWLKMLLFPSWCSVVETIEISRIVLVSWTATWKQKVILTLAQCELQQGTVGSTYKLAGLAWRFASAAELHLGTALVGTGKFVPGDMGKVVGDHFVYFWGAGRRNKERIGLGGGGSVTVAHVTSKVSFPDQAALHRASQISSICIAGTDQRSPISVARTLFWLRGNKFPYPKGTSNLLLS